MSRPEVKIYTTRTCPYCIRAKGLFSRLGVTFEEVALDGTPELRAELSARFGWRTVPMITIGGRFVGGCDDVHALHRTGELGRLLGLAA